MDSILTLRQYAAKDWQRMVDEYDLSLKEVSELYPVYTYRSAWWRYVEEAFETGRDFTPQAVARLDAAQLRDLSRTTRGLRTGLPRNYLLRGSKIATA